MKPKIKLTSLVGFILMILVLSSLSGCIKRPVQVGKNALDWTLPVVANPLGANTMETIQLSTLLKEPTVNYVLVTFWATWFPESKLELAKLEAEYQKYKEKGLVVLAISIDEGADVDILKSLISITDQDKKAALISYPILWDKANTVRNIYNIGAIPCRFIVDKQNKIVYKSSSLSESILEEVTVELAKLMNKEQE